MNQQEVLVNHLLTTGAYTKKNLGYKLPGKKTLRAEVRRVVSSWWERRVNLEVFLSPVTYEELCISSRTKKLPPLCLQPGAGKDFTKIPSSLHPIEVRDARNVLLAYRFRIPQHLVETLERSNKALPARNITSNTRGSFSSRIYALWGDYAKDLRYSKDYLDEKDPADSWREQNQPLFTWIGNEYRLVNPEGYLKLTSFSYAKPLEPLVEPWHAVQISLGMVGEASETHQDWQDEKSLHNVVLPTGQFRGGWVRLWQPEVEIEVSRGEGLIFNGRLVAHDVGEVVEGVRDVVDLFVHHSNFCDRERKRQERVGEEVLEEEAKRAKEKKLRRRAKEKKKEKERKKEREERKERKKKREEEEKKKKK